MVDRRLFGSEVAGSILLGKSWEFTERMGRVGGRSLGRVKVSTIGVNQLDYVLGFIRSRTIYKLEGWIL